MSIHISNCLVPISRITVVARQPQGLGLPPPDSQLILLMSLYPQAVHAPGFILVQLVQSLSSSGESIQLILLMSLALY